MHPSRTGNATGSAAAVIAHQLKYGSPLRRARLCHRALTRTGEAILGQFEGSRIFDGLQMREQAFAARFLLGFVCRGSDQAAEVFFSLGFAVVFQGEQSEAGERKTVERLHEKGAHRRAMPQVETDVLLDTTDWILREGRGMNDRGSKVIEKEFSHHLYLVAGRSVALVPLLVIVKVRAQIRPLDEDAEVIGSLHHGALHQLDLRLLTRVIEKPPRRLQLLAAGAKLPHEDRVIEQTCNHEEQGADRCHDGNDRIDSHFRFLMDKPRAVKPSPARSAGDRMYGRASAGFSGWQRS